MLCTATCPSDIGFRECGHVARSSRFSKDKLAFTLTVHSMALHVSQNAKLAWWRTPWQLRWRGPSSSREQCGLQQFKVPSSWWSRLSETVPAQGGGPEVLPVVADDVCAQRRNRTAQH